MMQADSYLDFGVLYYIVKRLKMEGWCTSVSILPQNKSSSLFMSHLMRILFLLGIFRIRSPPIILFSMTLDPTLYFCHSSSPKHHEMTQTYPLFPASAYCYAPQPNATRPSPSPITHFPSARPSSLFQA